MDKLLVGAFYFFGILCLANSQYFPEGLSPDDGVFIGECTFHRDNRVFCSGRLTCHTREARDRSAADLERICPREPSERSGTWDPSLNMLPQSVQRAGGADPRLARCKFYAKHGQGPIACTGRTNDDVWKGSYEGTLNTIFNLGLPRFPGDTGGQGNGGRPYDPSSIRYTTRYPHGSNYDRTVTPAYYVTPQGGRLPYGRDDYSTTPRYGGYDPYTTRRYPTDPRDPYPRDPRYPPTPDNFNPSRDESSSEITMCQYNNDRSGLCRECTERVARTVTARENLTEYSYTCRAEKPTSWTENSSFMRDGTPLFRQITYKHVIATCIFRRNTSVIPKYECHSGASDGSCSLVTTGSSDFSRSLERCLVGEKWSGNYHGQIY